MHLIIACFSLVVQVCSLPLVPVLEPPQDVRVEGGLLTWTSASEETNVSYTVQHRGFNTIEWENVPDCVHTPFTFCNIGFSKDDSQHGCIMLRVHAERHGLISSPVEACSTQGDFCTPKVILTVRPGSLTVNLNRNHSMVQEYGGHVEHRVFYGKQGEFLQDYKDGPSSVTINELEQGQHYCVKVQYIYYNKVPGPESCIYCELIPERKKDDSLTNVIAAVVGVVVLAVLVIIVSYFVIFHPERIKRWLQPPYDIPNHFLLHPGPESHLPSPSSDEFFNDVTVEARGE